MYLDSINYEKKNNLDLIKKLINNKINFISRRQIFCNTESGRCEMLTSDLNKIYRDHIHFTEAGAIFLSKKLNHLKKYLP